MARRVLQPRNELETMLDHRPRRMERLLNQLAEAHIRGTSTGEPIQRLADEIRWSRIFADLLGRRRILLEVAAVPQSRRFQSVAEARYVDELSPNVVPAVPRVPFEDAVEALIDRAPVVIREGLADRAAEVARVYNEAQGFALARNTDQVVARKVQDILTRALARGEPRPSVTEQIMEMGDFTQGYAKTVMRTNLATAYTDGRMREARGPVVREVMPAFEYLAVTDRDVRRGREQDHGENHLALHKMVADTQWPGWGIWAPPNGFNCRCTVRLVSRFELERRGLIVDGQVLPPVVPREASINPNFAGPRRFV